MSIANHTFLLNSTIASFNSQSSSGVCLLNNGTIRLE